MHFLSLDLRAPLILMAVPIDCKPQYVNILVNRALNRAIVANVTSSSRKRSVRFLPGRLRLRIKRIAQNRHYFID